MGTHILLYGGSLSCSIFTTVVPKIRASLLSIIPVFFVTLKSFSHFHRKMAAKQPLPKPCWGGGARRVAEWSIPAAVHQCVSHVRGFESRSMYVGFSPGTPAFLPLGIGLPLKSVAQPTKSVARRTEAPSGGPVN
ncbi:hypothetical protein HOLleu_21794 [Holothuria leucospilota]|uniref:Uncharacterized protein n=1 Tax=Holothuria leucospilota TaxID=206669 RepID=A0A9Q1H6Q8_HOLLE|nr:hypothetical protein HOLleu_21794 [Holothuria leucospilota]